MSDKLIVHRGRGYKKWFFVWVFDGWYLDVGVDGVTRHSSAPVSVEYTAGDMSYGIEFTKVGCVLLATRVETNGDLTDLCEIPWSDIHATRLTLPDGTEVILPRGKR